MAGLLSGFRTGALAETGSSLSRFAVEAIRVVQTNPGTRERTVSYVGNGSAAVQRICQTGGWLSSGRIAEGWIAVLILNHARAGAFSAQGCAMEPGWILLYGPGVTHFSFSKGAAECTWVFLPLESVRAFGPVRQELLPRFAQGSWLVVPERARLERMCQVLDSINGSPKSAASLPLVCNNASAGGRKLLEVLTDLASSAAFRQVHVSRQENIAAAAMNYIHQRGNQTVYESELCSTCGVRERALQKAFKVLLHVSPMRYLKLRRLHAARDALLNASEQWSVKRAALEAGFRDLGRFAADYSRVFGESPSATLKGLRAPRDRKPRPTGQRILHSGLR